MMSCCGNDSPLAEYRSQDWVHHFQHHLGKLITPKEGINFLDQEAHSSPRMISAKDFVESMQRIEFDDTRLHGMAVLNRYIRMLDEKDFILLLETFKTTDLKLEALKRIANTYVESTPEGQAIIISKSFTFQKDREAAKALMDSIPAKNRLFGSITEPMVSFVFSISKSMDQNMTVGGKTISRLNYVKEQLKKTIETQMSAKQKFNVFTYYVSATRMNGMWLDATQSNSKLANGFIDRQTSGGGENLKSGLDYAFDTREDLHAIYLVTDNTVGTTLESPDAIKEYIKTQVSKRKQNVALHTIALVPSGGKEKKEVLEKTALALQGAATCSGGTFRVITN